MEKSKFQESKDKIIKLITRKEIIKIKGYFKDNVRGTYQRVYKKVGSALEGEKISYILFNNKTLVELVDVLNHFLKVKNEMEVKTFLLDNGEIVIQGRVKNGDIKQFVGLDKAIAIHIKDYKNGQIEILISSSKWMDKAFAGTLSGFVFWPIIAVPVIGTYKQIELIQGIKNELADYFSFE